MPYKIPSARGSVLPGVPFGSSSVFSVPQPLATIPGVSDAAIRSSREDRRIRRWIKNALLASGAFDEVILGDSEGETDSRFWAAVEPEETDYKSEWKDAEGISLICDTRVSIWFIGTESDQQVRDETLEVMLYHALNVLQFSNLGGSAMPKFSQCDRVAWEKVKEKFRPERKLRLTFRYRFYVGIQFPTA